MHQIAEVCLIVYTEEFRARGCFSWIDLACLLLEVCLRADQSHGNSVILSHMQTLFVSLCRVGPVLYWQPCDSPQVVHYIEPYKNIQTRLRCDEG